MAFFVKSQMTPISNLNAILQDDYSLKYDWEAFGLQDVAISTHKIGELILTSGRIIVCDPLIVPDVRYHLKKASHYPEGSVPAMKDAIPAIAKSANSKDRTMSCMSDEVPAQIARGANAELSAVVKHYLVP